MPNMCLKQIPSILLGCLVAWSGPIGASEGDFWIGPSVSHTDWNVGIVRKYKDGLQLGDVAFGALGASSQGGAAIFLSDVESSRMRLLGLSGAYLLSDRWSLAFKVAKGSATFPVARNLLLTPGASNQTTGFYAFQVPVETRRSDYDLSFQRSLGGGWAWFFGLKQQRYSYTGAPTAGVGGSQTVSSQGTTSTVTPTGNAFMFHSKATAPALGLAYTWALTDRTSLGGQVGAVFLRGSLTTHDSRLFAIPVSSGTGDNRLMPVLFSFNTAQDYTAPGYTARLAYNFKVNEDMLLRIDFRHQETTIKVGKVLDASILLTEQFVNPGAYLPPATPPATIAANARSNLIAALIFPSFWQKSVNGAIDRYRGFTVEFLYRL